MNNAPLPLGLRPSGAAEAKQAEREPRVYGLPAEKSQVSDALDLGEARFQRDIKRLHDAGPRALYHALDELGARFLRRSEIEAVVRRYGRLDRATVEAVGGRDFPPLPLHRVGGP